MSDRAFPGGPTGLGVGRHSGSSRIGPRPAPGRQAQHGGPGGGFRHGLYGGGWGTTGWGWANWTGWWPVTENAIGGCVWTLLGEVQPSSAPPADWPKDVTDVALHLALSGTEQTLYYQSRLGYFRLTASAGSCLVAVCQSMSGYNAATGTIGVGAPHVGPILTPQSGTVSGTAPVSLAPASNITPPAPTAATVTTTAGIPTGAAPQYFAPAAASTTNTGLVILGVAVAVLGLGGFAYLVHEKHLQDQGAK